MESHPEYKETTVFPRLIIFSLALKLKQWHAPSGTRSKQNDQRAQRSWHNRNGRPADMGLRKNQPYINKIVEHHGWQNVKHAKLPIPMRTDSTYYLAELELTDSPDDPDKLRNLEKEIGFNYRQVIGEAIFAMTLFRTNIATAIIKLYSQYSSHPAKCHYLAAKALLVYLYATRNDGIYYWRNGPNTELPTVDLPTTITKHEKLKPYFQCHDPLNLEGASDSTWATDRQHPCSTGARHCILLCRRSSILFSPHPPNHRSIIY
jgi:hypothetical protein